MLKFSDFVARPALLAVAYLLSCLFVLFGASSAARAADDFLDPAVAFKFSATERPGEIEVRYKVADGYYMYRERFAFAAKGGDATLGPAQLPAGKVHFDQTFNKDVETYRGERRHPDSGEAGERTVRPRRHVAGMRRCRASAIRRWSVCIT